MDFYALTLGLALAAMGVELLLLLVHRLAPDRIIPRRVLPTLRRVGIGAGVAALGLLALSVAHHVAVGHTPGSESGMSPAAFVAEHPAFPISAALTAVGLALLRRSKRG